MITRLTDPDEIEAAVARQRERLRQDGFPEMWAETGIVFEDQYVRVIRDAVRFENAGTGTYIRIEFREGVRGGVVIIPRLAQHYLIAEHFRYATGKSHLEFPRGFLEPDEIPSDGAMRELLEETGASVETARFLGRIFADTGLIGAPVYVFVADVRDVSQPVDDEAISRFLWLTRSELMAAIRDDRIDDGLTLAAAMLLSVKEP